MELNIVMVQPDIVWEDKKANLNAYAKAIERVDGPFDIVLLPELFTTGFTMNTSLLAENMQGISVNWMAEMVRTYKCSLAGSLIIEQDGKFFNRLVWMHENGQVQYYDKRHLFRMGEEDRNYTAGHSLLTVRQGAFRIRPLICYDLRFPVWSRNKDEYDVLIYVANWPAARQDAWSSLLKARSIENMAYVIGVNRTGSDGRGIDYLGGSLVHDARGSLIASLPGNSPGTLSASLSLEELNSCRVEFPVHKDADSFRISD